MIIRKATMADIPAIYALINTYARQGLMLRRPMMTLFESVRDFAVVEENGQVVGSCGLHVLWSDLAEIRSLAAHPDMARRGIGRGLVEFMVQDAAALGITRLFAFTYQLPFFEKCNFTVVKKEILPQKVWKECIYCDKFNCCDEIAVIRYLQPGAEAVQEAHEEIPLIDVPLWTVK